MSEREARTYIGAIRGSAKRCYAWRYLRWRTGPTDSPFDVDGGPEDASLPSYMARQAVRLRVDELLAKGGDPR